MNTVSIDIETNLEGLKIKDPLDKFAKQISEQYRAKLGIAVTHEINGNTVNIILQKEGKEKRKIPYKIINGRIVVPKEFQKYVSKDGKSINMNEASDYSKVIDEIDLNIFK